MTEFYSLDALPPNACGCAYCQNEQSHADLNTDPTIILRDSFIISGAGGAVTPADIGTNNALELIHGYEWGLGGGTAVNVTFSFPNAVPSYYSSSADERFLFSAFTSEMKTAVRDVLGSISEFANITFTEVSGNGDIVFGQALLDFNVNDGLLYAYGYYPDQGNLSGDVWFNNFVNYPTIMDQGDLGYYIAQHEIGHALGLMHSFTQEIAPDVFTGAGFTGEENTEKFTVMAYWPDNPANDPWGQELFASSYMLYDIYALQSIYGVNTSHNSGDTVYTLDPTRAYTVWDGGGVDTFDASAVSSNTIIHLEEGGYSSVGLNENIAISYGTIIENAKTGTGNDEIYGNSADNIMDGGTGNDAYHYVSGDDVIRDGGDTDTVYLPVEVSNENYVAFLRYVTAVDDLIIQTSNSNTNDVLGTITIEGQFETSGAAHVENLEFFSGANVLLNTLRVTTFGSDGVDNIDGVENGAHPDDTIYGFAGDDVISGLSGQDTVYGGEGVDYLYGGAGRDALFGNQGDDILYGGDDGDYLFGDKDDTAASENYSGNDIIFGEGGDDWIEGNKGDDTISGGDGSDIIIGGEGNDNLFGDAGDDYLIGDVGNDVLNGGAGADALYGGAGADTFRFDQFALDAIDTIYDFGSEDSLNFDDLINVYSNLDILISDNGTDSFVSVDTDGGADSYTQIATLLGYVEPLLVPANDDII